MKKSLLLIAALLLLTACTSQTFEAERPDVISKKPRLPRIVENKPKIPEKAMQANVLGSTDIKIDYSKVTSASTEDIIRSTITLDDIEKGWYFASEDEKKTGTPDTWIWIDERSKSRWSSPAAVDNLKEEEDKKLCEQTSGEYVISCIDQEDENCVYRSESFCRCTNFAKWFEEQGCVISESISTEDVMKGWYYGERSEKKKNTPPSWIWRQRDDGSRWQNPPRS